MLFGHSDLPVCSIRERLAVCSGPTGSGVDGTQLPISLQTEEHTWQRRGAVQTVSKCGLSSHLWLGSSAWYCSVPNIKVVLTAISHIMHCYG